MLTLAVLLLASAPQAQADLNRRTGSAYQSADAALNVQYRATMAAMKAIDAGGPAPDAGPGPTYQAALLASQRSWLAYRDAQCLLAGYEFRGGSAQGMAHQQCMTDLTRRRTAELRQIQQSLSPK